MYLPLHNYKKFRRDTSFKQQPLIKCDNADFLKLSNSYPPSLSLAIVSFLIASTRTLTYIIIMINYPLHNCIY